MIDLHQVTFSYSSELVVFEDFTWQVEAGEVWSILGPSGCGKSTLLMLLAGLLHPRNCAVTIGGHRIVRPRPRTGLILQNYGLLPWATVYDNVALGLRIRRFYGPDGRHVPRDEQLKRAQVRNRVDHWLERLDIADLAEKYPSQISGGQRQRTAIARTLALEPDLLLMDEPFSSLDAPTREALQILTLELCQEAALTVILVTHNMEEATFMGQKILLLRDPPNREADVIENAHSADEAYRGSDAYQDTCTSLRRGMSE